MVDKHGYHVHFCNSSISHVEGQEATKDDYELGRGEPRRGIDQVEGDPVVTSPVINESLITIVVVGVSRVKVHSEDFL